MFGGIAGAMYGTNTTISQCYNKVPPEKEIYGKYNLCGGIVGWAEGTIEDCYNMSNVRGYTYIGGIAGAQFGGSTFCRNLYNTGSIKGQNYLGGIVGAIGETTCNNLINIGEIDKTSKESFISEIAGEWQSSAEWGEGVWLETKDTSWDDMKTWTNTTIKTNLSNNFTKDTTQINGGLPILEWQIE